MHVCSAWLGPGGQLHNILVGPHSPRHPLDALALAFARARAERIVLSGQILRDEPTLAVELLGPAPQIEALARWRAEHVGLDPPRLEILSHRPIPADHPVRSGWARPAEPAAPVAPPDPGAWLAGLAGACARGTVSLELGPRATAPLYRARLVDESMLTIVSGPVDPRHVGAPMPELGPLEPEPEPEPELDGWIATRAWPPGPDPTLRWRGLWRIWARQPAAGASIPGTD